MSFSANKSIAQLAAALGVTVFMATPAFADSGFFIGGSVGGATLESDFGSGGPPIPGIPTSLDEDDTAFKAFAGYTFDLPLIDVGIEGGYVDFGGPEFDVLGSQLAIDTSGLNLWGVATFNVTLFDVFAKLGYISWDIDATFEGESSSDDGTDLGYGIGVGFGLGPVRIRGEYELYDIDEFDLAMLSVGVEFRF